MIRLANPYFYYIFLAIMSFSAGACPRMTTGITSISDRTILQIHHLCIPREADLEALRISANAYKLQQSMLYRSTAFLKENIRGKYLVMYLWHPCSRVTRITPGSLHLILQDRNKTQFRVFKQSPDAPASLWIMLFTPVSSSPPKWQWQRCSPRVQPVSPATPACS